MHRTTSRRCGNHAAGGAPTTGSHREAIASTIREGDLPGSTTSWELRLQRGHVTLIGGGLVVAVAVVTLAFGAATAEPATAPAPTFSHDSGVASFPVELTIEGDDRIVYTLDGTTPDPDRNPGTHVYDGPIVLDDPTGPVDLDNGLAGHWTGFSPWHPQRRESRATDRIAVVRARVVGGPESTLVLIPRPRELPVVSIATDPDHLFHHETGIYVAGLLYEEYTQSDAFNPDHSWDVPANAHQRGREWERPPVDDLDRAIVFTYCPPYADRCAITQHVGLRIHGGFSRSLPAKSLRLYARNDYGQRTFAYRFFGDDAPVGHRRLILRTSGNDWGSTMLLDGFLHDLARPMGLDAQAYQPVALFINGEYWGIHNLRERYDRHYLEVVHGVDPDTVVLLGRHLEVEEGDDDAAEPFWELLGRLLRLPLGDPAAIDDITAHVDVDDLFDYVILQTFAGNSDWPDSNLRMWRVAVDDPPAGLGVADGRWRWLVFDLDRVGDHVSRYDPEFDALGRLLADGNDRAWGEGLPLLLKHVLADPTYRQQFVERYLEHLDSTFAAERTLPALDAAADRIASEIPHHIDRWAYPESVDAWHDQLAVLRHYLSERPHHARAQLLDLLDGTPVVDVKDAA